MDAVNHFTETDDVPPLSEVQAMQQLQYDLRHQMGTLSFRTVEFDDDHRYDGRVEALINGEEVDHYLYGGS